MDFQKQVKLDPHTTIASLLLAIPSSTLVFGRLGIDVRGNESESLQAVCSAAGISVEKLWEALDEIDWSEESLHAGNLERS